MMQTQATNKWDDTVLPFQLDAADVRGRVVRLDDALQKILSQHNYPLSVSALVAEAALLTAMIGQTIALRWKLSLQIRGNGPVRFIATDYFAPTEEGEPAKIRAYASFDADQVSSSSDDGFALLGKGMFAVLIDQGGGTQPYQGITPLKGGSLVACAEEYFAQSEQLPTRFVTKFGQTTDDGNSHQWRGGGLMLQHMPKASPFAKTGSKPPELPLGATDAENWNRAVMFMDTVEETELIGPHVGQQQLLRRLFNEEKPRVFDSQPITFGCTCAEEKVRQTMSIYSAKDIAHMTADNGMVTADCQFCGMHYELAPETVGKDAK